MARSHKIIAILLYPGMTALDAIGPYEILRNLPNTEVCFVWKTVSPIITDSEVLVLGATHTMAQVPDPDVILIPGSSGDTPVMMADEEVLSWIKRAHEHTTFTTSVCSGALILGAAGILEGHPATTHWAGMQALELFGATPKPRERVVRAGKIITAAGVSAGIDMALELAAILADEHTARTIQLWIEYDPQPPFDSGHTSKAPADVRRRARGLANKEAMNLRSAASLPAILLRRFQRLLTARAGARPAR